MRCGLSLSRWFPAPNRRRLFRAVAQSLSRGFFFLISRHTHILWMLWLKSVCLFYASPNISWLLG